MVTQAIPIFHSYSNISYEKWELFWNFMHEILELFRYFLFRYFMHHRLPVSFRTRPNIRLWRSLANTPAGMSWNGTKTESLFGKLECLVALCRSLLHPQLIEEEKFWVQKKNWKKKKNSKRKVAYLAWAAQKHMGGGGGVLPLTGNGGPPSGIVVFNLFSISSRFVFIPQFQETFWGNRRTKSWICRSVWLDTLDHFKQIFKETRMKRYSGSNAILSCCSRESGPWFSSVSMRCLNNSAQVHGTHFLFLCIHVRLIMYPTNTSTHDICFTIKPNAAPSLLSRWLCCSNTTADGKVSLFLFRDETRTLMGFSLRLVQDKHRGRTRWNNDKTPEWTFQTCRVLWILFSRLHNKNKNQAAMSLTIPQVGEICGKGNVSLFSCTETQGLR